MLVICTTPYLAVFPSVYFLFIYLSIYLSIFVYLSISIYLLIYLSIQIFQCMSAYLHVSLSINRPIYMYTMICAYIHLNIYIYIYIYEGLFSKMRQAPFQRKWFPKCQAQVCRLCFEKSSSYIYIYLHIYEELFPKTPSLNLALTMEIHFPGKTRFEKELFICNFDQYCD